MLAVGQAQTPLYRLGYVFARYQHYILRRAATCSTKVIVPVLLNGWWYARSLGFNVLLKLAVSGSNNSATLVFHDGGDVELLSLSSRTLSPALLCCKL